MNWYSGAQVERPIDKLIDSGITKVTQLLEDSDFFSQLKAFNPKLLDFLTSNPWIVEQALLYVIQSPKDSDSDERKYKYPMMTAQMVETQTVSIVNAFFKPGAQGGLVADHLFKILNQQEIIPILAGYFVRIICIILKLRYKQTLDYVYSSSDIMKKMINHTYNISITQSLQMFLCLQSTKAERIIQGKQSIKIDILSLLIKQLISSKDSQMISNISYLIISLVDGYYLISDSKKMLEAILTKQFSEYLFSSISKQNCEQSVFLLMNSILRYYVFSSFNIQQKQTPQFNSQNAERLQQQPFIQCLVHNFATILNKSISYKSILSRYYLIEILSHTIQLNSPKIYEQIKINQFFKKMIEQIFKIQDSNILHQLINKLIETVFSNEKVIYDKYQQHLFCDVDIIKLTIVRIENENLKSIGCKGYFGHLIKIIKNYSKIQTSNTKIYEVIEKYKDLWTKVANGIIKSYTEVIQKQLGTYQIPDPKPIEYKQTRTSVTVAQPIMMANLNIDDEAKAFRNMTTSYPQSGRISFGENLFQLPPDIQSLEQKSQKHESVQQLVQAGAQQRSNNSSLTIDIPDTNQKVPPPASKSPSWQQYKKSASKKAQQKIQLQKRSISKQKQRRATPNNRGKSPVGAMKIKKQSWGSNNDQKSVQQSKTKQSDKSAIAQSKIPAVPKSTISQSMIFTKQPVITGNKPEMLAKSMGNLNDLKSIKVKFVPSNKVNDSKKFRKIQAKDMLLLNFLGIKVNGGK